MPSSSPRPQPLARAAVGREAFTAAQQITNDWARSRAVRQMVSVLPPDCVPAALDLARALATPNLRARTLMAVSRAAPEADRPALLAEAEQVIYTIDSPAGRAGPLSVLAERLSGAAKHAAAQAALAGAAEEQDVSERGWLIVALMPHLPPAAQGQALDQLRTIAEVSIRAATLAHAALALPEAAQAEVLADGLAQAQAIPDAEARARTLAAVQEALPAAERSPVAVAILAAAALLNDEGQWARAVGWSAAALPPADLAAAYPAALALTALEPRAEALGALARAAMGGERPARLAEALAAAAIVPDDWGVAFAVGRLAAHLPPALHAPALAAARVMGDAWARSDLLADLTDAMDADQKAAVLTEALAAARAAQPWPRARALTGVAAKCAP